MEVKTKKTAVDLTELAIGIIILGIVVSIGAYILTTQRDSRLTDLPSNTATNETVAASGDTFANTWFKSIASCVNATNGAAVGSGNYSISTSAIDGTATISNLTTTFSAYNMNCTYDYYDITQADWALADEAATGIGEFGNWFKIIVIVGVSAVVLSLIFLAFGRGKEGSTTY